MTSLDPGTQAALTDAEDHGPERSAERAQARTLMEARIDRLPEVYRTVFMLRGVQELTVEEVAEALDVPQATVRTRYFRARRLLRQSLAGEMETALGDAFAFDGSRCDRLVAEVLRRIGAEGVGPAEPLVRAGAMPTALTRCGDACGTSARGTSRRTARWRR
jgi:RNA polymerase sigma-70 factor (ECF subfamily)